MKIRGIISLLMVPALIAGALLFPWKAAHGEESQQTAIFFPLVVKGEASLSALPIWMPLLLRADDDCIEIDITDPGYWNHQADMRQIQADDAWQCELGDPGIVVAVIDTGVDLSHPDLVANLITGYDFVGDDNQPQDGNGHGSNVAGIVAAALNGLGVVGVAPNVRLLPVKVLSDDGSGSMSDVIDGIVFAADRANILNLSLGGTSSSQSLLDAVKYATNKGRLVVASGGNCGDPNTYALNGCSSVNQPLYPGAYSQVMAVAAVTSNDTRAAFSNQNNTIDISAPGVSIYNTYRNGGYAAYSGTSQAAPHVSGQAGLIWSHQRSFTATQVREAIESSAIDLGAAGWDPSYGWGRIDVMAAISMQVIDFQQAKSDAADPSDPTEDRTAAIQPGSVLVKFNTQTTQAKIENLINTIPGAEIIDSIDAIGWSVLGVTPGSEWRTVELLRALPEVAYAEPDFLLQLIP